MERLTKRLENGKIAYALIEPGECVDVIDLLHVYGDRLADYEDTGLEPEEITVRPYGCVFYCNRQCNLNGDFCAEGPGCPWELDSEAALKLLDERKPNDPLTLEELREMDGEPVWVILEREEVVPTKGWALVETEFDYVVGVNFFLDFEDYGAWLGYRRKPEEGTM